MKFTEQAVLGLALATCLAVRLAHLAGPLDAPMWRQTDTAYMAVRMMNESPPDLLNPKAPYRGTNDVKAAEFPIYPALVSLAYKAAGRESLPLARAVTLVFFAGSAWLLYLSISLIADRRIALWTTGFYCAAPLGIAYSRMVHPDFAIVFFGHVFLYGLLRFVQTGKPGWWTVGVAGGVGAFLMKAPYCFYLGLLPGWWWLVDREKRTAARFLGLATVLILPLAAALWFNAHRIAQEAPFAESLVYPMKWTAESSAGRFFGRIADRLDPEGWKTIVKRMLWLVLTPPGVALALAGLWPRPSRVPMAWMPQVLAAGAALYILVVFPMVAGGHEYYTIPLMAPAALLAGIGTVRIADACARRFAWSTAVVTLALLTFIASGVQAGLRKGPYVGGVPYFSVDWQRIRAGETIRSATGPDDLVIAVSHGRSTGWSDPRILYVADRRGWAVELPELNATNLAAFVEAGADVAAVLVTPEAETRYVESSALNGLPFDSYPLTNAGATIGTLRVYRELPRPISATND